MLQLTSIYLAPAPHLSPILALPCAHAITHTATAPIMMTHTTTLLERSVEDTREPQQNPHTPHTPPVSPIPRVRPTRLPATPPATPPAGPPLHGRAHPPDLRAQLMTSITSSRVKSDPLDETRPMSDGTSHHTHSTTKTHTPASF